MNFVLLCLIHCVAGVHVNVYGGSRHDNVVRALALQSCFVCKWPIHFVDVADIEECVLGGCVVTHPLIKDYAVEGKSIVVATNGSLDSLPSRDDVVVVIAPHSLLGTTRRLKVSRPGATVHFFPVNTFRTPFSSGSVSAQCNPNVLAHRALLSTLLS